MLDQFLILYSVKR